MLHLGTLVLLHSKRSKNVIAHQDSFQPSEGRNRRTPPRGPQTFRRGNVSGRHHVVAIPSKSTPTWGGGSCRQTTETLDHSTTTGGKLAASYTSSYPLRYLNSSFTHIRCNIEITGWKLSIHFPGSNPKLTEKSALPDVVDARELNPPQNSYGGCLRRSERT